MCTKKGLQIPIASLLLEFLVLDAYKTGMFDFLFAVLLWAGCVKDYKSTHSVSVERIRYVILIVKW